MPYDIRRNYRGKSGYSVVGPDGKNHGTHPTRTAAIEQQRALYAAESRVKKEVMPDLESKLVPEEKALHDALLTIVQQYGKFNQDYSGVWAGYDPPERNDSAAIGVKCSNCALYAGDNICEINSLSVEPEGRCRFAVIPDGYVTGTYPNDRVTQKNFWGGRFSNK